jgi:hypothetical protein
LRRVFGCRDHEHDLSGLNLRERIRKPEMAGLDNHSGQLRITEGYSGRGQNRLVISACQKLETARFPGELSYHTQFSRTRAATCIIPLDSPGMKSQISAS